MQPDQLSSPLHQPLAHFDPDTNITGGEVGPSESTRYLIVMTNEQELQPPSREGFGSAWERLLAAHAVSTSQQPNDRERNGVHLHTPTPHRHPAVPNLFSSPPATPEPGPVDSQTLRLHAEKAPGGHPPGNGRTSWLGRIITPETHGRPVTFKSASCLLTCPRRKPSSPPHCCNESDSKP